MKPLAPLAAPALALVCACAGPVPDIVPERDLQAQLALPAPIEFRTEGEPLDLTALPLQGEPLRRAHAILHALQHAPELQAACASVYGALAEADAARRWGNPLLSVVARGGNGTPAYEASLVAPFVQILQTPTRARAADARLRQAAAQALTTALDVLADVDHKYLAAQRADAAAEHLVARARLAGELVAMAEQRLGAGEASAAEVAALRTRHGEVELERSRAQGEREAARLVLAARLGMPSGACDWLLEALTVADATVPGDEGALLAAALAVRPELQELQWELRALGAEVDLAAFAPWLASTVGAETQRTPTWYTGPNLSIPVPVFDDGSAGQRAVAAQQVVVRHRAVATARAIVAEVRTSLRAASAAQARHRTVHEQLLPQQLHRAAQTEAALRAGEADTTTSLRAREELLAAQSLAAETTAELAATAIALRRATAGALTPVHQSDPTDAAEVR